jgi:hypothetical protein
LYQNVAVCASHARGKYGARGRKGRASQDTLAGRVVATPAFVSLRIADGIRGSLAARQGGETSLAAIGRKQYYAGAPGAGLRCCAGGRGRSILAKLDDRNSGAVDSTIRIRFE